MPGQLIACPVGTLPNTGTGTPPWIVFVLLALLLVAVVAGLRWRTLRLGAVGLLVLTGLGAGGASAAADCTATGTGTPSQAQVFAASVSRAAGGEPNVAISPSGRNVMVSGLGPTSPATLYRSTDYGLHFTAIHPTFAHSGGGDWDMRWIDDTHIIAADLSIGSGIYIHRSSDVGDHWTTSNINLEVFDRPWLDHFGANLVYVVAKGFDGIPRLYQSSDGGATFGNIVPLLVYGLPNSGGPDTPASFITGQNAYVDHMLVDARTGDVYVLYGAQPGSTYSAGQPEGVPNQLYVAHLENGQMISRPVYLGASDVSCLAGFNWLTEDQAGTLYVLGNCRVNGRWSTWLSFSRDHGHHWSELVDTAETGAANVYGSIFGAAAGNLELIYLRGSNGDPSTSQDWHAQMAAITQADTANPIVVSRVRPLAAPMHQADICFDGILCGTVPPFGNNRNLLDYIWDAIGPDGTSYGVFASDGPATGNNGGTPDVVILRQAGGPSLGRGVPS